jgi:hypothetical protein
MVFTATYETGGNREIETTPRPRLSVKLAYWLSDVSEPGRGNLKVVPGGHVVNRIDGPPRRDPRSILAGQLPTPFWNPTGPRTAPS